MKIKIKENIAVYFIIGMLLALLVYLTVPKIIDKIELFYQESVVNDSADKSPIVLTTTGIEQDIKSPYSKIKKISLQIGTYEEQLKGKISLQIWNKTKNRKVVQADRDFKYISNNENVEFVFQSPIILDGNSEYSFRIKQEAEGNQSAAVFGEGKQICYTIYGYNSQNNGVVFFVAETLIVLAVMMMIRQVILRQLFDSINAWDIFFVLFAVFLCCFFFSQGGDMKITLRHSKDLLSIIKQGQFMQFYDIVLDKALSGGYFTGEITDAANYNIFLYLILSICILPYCLFIKIFGLGYSDSTALLYFNLILAAAVLFSAYMVYRLMLTMGGKNRQAKLTAYIYLSSVMLLFATVGFSQMDIFYVLFVLWALKYYLNKKYLQFSVLMSISIMLKTFPILIFVPLILIVEKRILHIFKYLILGLGCSLVYGVVFGNDVGYSYTKMKLGEIYGFTDRLFANGIDGGMGRCALLIFIVVCLCVWCFDKRAEDGELWKYVVNVPIVVFGAFMIFVGWHPQWLTIITPFMAMAVGINTKRRSLLYCEWGIGVMYCLISFIRYAGAVDNYMINRGILPLVCGRQYSGVSLGIILGNIDNLSIAIMSLFVALIAYFCYYSWVDLTRVRKIDEFQDVYLERWLIYARCATIYAITLLFVIMYCYVG